MTSKSYLTSMAARASGVVLGLACLVAGCSHPFVEASDTFATATKNGTTGVAPMFDSAARICRRRASLDYLFHRQMGEADQPWSKWYTDHLVTPPNRTWSTDCEKLAISDVILAKSCDALAAYATSMQAVTSGATYDGKNITTLATDVAALGNQLAGNTTESKAATDALAGLGSPLATLAKGAVQNYAGANLRESVRQSAPAVRQVLGALELYAKATMPSIEAAERELANVLDRGDVLIRATETTAGDGGVTMGRPDPLRVAAFHDAALRYEGELAQVRAEWNAYRRAIASLSKAHDALLQAADRKVSDEEALKSVLEFANDTGAQIVAIRSAFSGK